MATVETLLKGVAILGPLNDQTRKILTKDATAFVALLHRTFNPTRKALLQRRIDRQAEIDRGTLLDFLPETKHIRENDAWKGAPPAPGLVDRRVEITGPTDRKMVVNALNSDVYTYMADFEGEFRHISYFIFVVHYSFVEVIPANIFKFSRLNCSHLGEHGQWPG